MEGLQKWRLRWEIWRSMQNEGLFRGPARVGFLHKTSIGVEAHMEPPTGVALTQLYLHASTLSTLPKFSPFLRLHGSIQTPLTTRFV
jgi:hypothetical protein